ncbi:MAG: DNA-protecting protein DprA, partial [Candidatus Ancillula sp.]|nr:DNA-protecting protein DprA [Candidatus Ancillula sp.]
MKKKYYEFIRNLSDTEARVIWSYAGANKQMPQSLVLVNSLGPIEALRYILDDNINDNILELQKTMFEILDTINLKKVFEFLKMRKIRIITPLDKLWPQNFTSPLIGYNAPIILYILGDQNNFNKCKLDKMVSFVGSRNMTNYGKIVTNELVFGMLENGYSIISGGALGVDSV